MQMVAKRVHRNVIEVKLMKIFFYIVSIISAALAGLMLFITISTSNGAPQEAAGAAISACIAIIPYVFARSFEKLSASTGLEDLLKKQVAQNKHLIALQKKSQGLTLTDQEKSFLVAEYKE